MWAAIKKIFCGKSCDAGAHQRIHELLQEYWEKLRGARAFPSESQVDPAALASVWDACFLVHTDDKARADGYKFSYMGTRLIEAFGDDYTGREVCDHLANPAHPDLANHLNAVVQGKKPVLVESQFRNSRGMVVKYRCCLLPLGATDTQVDFILGGMKWKAY